MIFFIDDSGVGGVQAVWSAVNKAADIVLLNSDREAESAASTLDGGTVLIASGKTTGKFYAEITLTQLHNGSQAFAVGLHRGGASLATYVGGDADGWGSWVVGTGGRNRTTFHNGGSTTILTGQPSPSTGMRHRIAVDIGAGRLWLTYAGSSTWIGDGDPSAGTSPSFSWTPDAATYYIAGCPRSGDGSDSGNRNRLRLEYPEDWAFSAPTGFGVWTA